MKNKYYNIFFTSEKDGKGRNFRITSYSLSLGVFLSVAILVFAYIGFSYVIGQDELARKLKVSDKREKAMNFFLEQKGVQKHLIESSNLDKLIIDYILVNGLDYPEDVPVDGIVTKGILSIDGEIVYPGIDIATELKDKVKSPLSGEVESFGWNDILGNFIILKHDNNFKTTYGYLHTISTLVKLGKILKKVML